MPRKVKTHIVGGDTLPKGMTPKHLTKQEFAKRLYSLMTAKGWSQSELARRANILRDSVSVYMHARSLPTPNNLRKLAQALGCTEEELLPNYVESAIEEEQAAFEMKVSTSAPDTAWLRVNRLVTLATAVKIAEMLQNDDAIHRVRSGKAAQVQHVEDKEA